MRLAPRVTSILLLATFATLVRAETPSRLREGETLYRQHCAACHAPDASGGRGADLRKKLKHGDSPQALAKVIKRGIPEGQMPALDRPDPEIRKIVQYVQYLRKQTKRNKG